MRRLLVLTIAALLASTGCGSQERTSASLFSMDRDDIEAAVAHSEAIAASVLSSLATRDAEAFGALFAPDAYVVDPVVPSLRPTTDGWFSLFLGLCDDVSAGSIYVNVDGSASEATCDGFYVGTSADAPTSLDVMQEISFEGDLATTLINRLDAGTAGAYPADTSDAIGFAPSEEASVREQAATATAIATRFVEAWGTADEAAILALYAPTGVRHDAFAGLADDRVDTETWLATLIGSVDSIEIEIQSLQASGPGPSAAYRLTLGREGERCTMQLVSVWDLDAEGLVTVESVYYEPSSMYACDWDGR